MSEAATTQRFRAGAYSLLSVGTSIFLVVIGGALVYAALLGKPNGGVLAVGIGCALLGLAILPLYLEGLTPILVVPGEDGTVSVAQWSYRRGFRRTVWPLRDIYIVELVESRDFATNRRRYLRLANRRDELRSDSLTCSVRRRDPENSAAGRAVAQIRALVDEARGF